MEHLRALCTTELRAAESDFESGIVSQTISTEGLARDGAIIPADSWVLDAYRRNPVVLWAHDDGSRGPLPIARNVDVRVERGELVSVNQFDLEDAFAREVLRKIRLGMVNATSVRWFPIERPRVEKRRVTLADGSTLERDVVVFPRNELLEQSYVSVPADSAALIKRAAGDVFDIEEVIRAEQAAEAPRGPHWSVVKAEADLMARGLPLHGR